MPKKSLVKIRLRRVLSLSIALYVMLIFFLNFEIIKAKVRDVERKSDLKQIMTALDVYYVENGYYPESADDDGHGWDVSYSDDGQEFLTVLKKQDLINNVPFDPVNDKYYQYRYQRFDAGEYGCEKAFYILQLINFEETGDDRGQGRCPGIDFTELAPNGYTVQVFE